MPEHDEHRGAPWRDPNWSGPPPWAGRGRPGFDAGRRFRRGAIAVLVLVVLLVAALATVVASAFGGNAPHPIVTVPLALAVVAALIASARWLWRNTRAIGTLMDAADRVAGGDYTTRVEVTGSRQLGRLTSSFNQMTERLETDEARRRELLADVAHELRTPLQVIRGTVEGMLDGLYPADAERLRPLVEETVVMDRLLEDLRTLSMAEAGVLELHRETVDPRALAADVTTAFRSMADDAGVTLSVATAAGADATIEADPVRLSEVLTNLLTNAIRHTPREGTVTIRIATTPTSATFEVDDTGPGIDVDQLPFVFDRFVTSADAGGTGLGLAIAKRLVTAHGGAIEARPSAAGGTTIAFTIPSA